MSGVPTFVNAAAEGAQASHGPRLARPHPPKLLWPRRTCAIHSSPPPRAAPSSHATAATTPPSGPARHTKSLQDADRI